MTVPAFPVMPRSVLVAVLAAASLRSGGSQTVDQFVCPALLGCCEEDCCAEGTSWDIPSGWCVADPTSTGFTGAYSSDHEFGCVPRLCCETSCCGGGTRYDADLECCVPVPARIGLVEPFEHVILFNESNSGPHRFFYQSDLVAFPHDVPGYNKSAQVAVALFPFGEFSDAPTPTPNPDELLDQIQVFAEILDPNGNIVIPVGREDDFLEGSLEDVPETALGVLLTVETSLDSDFYALAVADVTLTSDEMSNVTIAGLEIIADEPTDKEKKKQARAKERKSNRLYKEAKELLKQAEEKAKQGKFDEAKTLLDRAIEKIKESAKCLDEAEQLLVGVPVTNGDRARLKKMSKTRKVGIAIARARFFLYKVLGFKKMPVINLKVCAELTQYLNKKIYLTESDAKDDGVVLHEYGHAVLKAKTKKKLPGGPHKSYESTTTKLAWSEGWATFFSCIARGDSTLVRTNATCDEIARSDIENNNYTAPGFTNRKPDPGGETVEMNVQAALWDIIDGGNSGFPDTDNDGLTVPLSEVWKCICTKKPVTLAEFISCLRASFVGMNDEAMKIEALRSVLIRNNIDPQDMGLPPPQNP